MKRGVIRSALVSGATGFIGGALVQRLARSDWTVTALVRDGSDLTALEALGVRTCRVDGSLETLSEIVRAVRPDVVFHLATFYVADHHPDQVGQLIDVNIRFPSQLLEAMAVAGCGKFVNAGTSWQQDGGSSGEPVNLYAATKEAFDAVVRYYAGARRIAALTLKLFDTYGPGDPRRKLVRLLVDAARSGEILDMSPGNQTVDLTHVDDVVDAFLAGTEVIRRMKPAHHREFLVSSERFVVKELVALVDGLAGGTLRVNFGGRQHRAREVMMPQSAEGRLVPGWAPRRRLADEISRLLRE